MENINIQNGGLKAHDRERADIHEVEFLLESDVDDKDSKHIWIDPAAQWNHFSLISNV